MIADSLPIGAERGEKTNGMSGQYEYHPACLMLPRMANDDFAVLRESVRQGFSTRHPIVLFEGKILDGRHRYEACQAEGVRPIFLDCTDIDPFDFVRREHAARRSWLSQEQKALVISNLVEGSAEYQVIQRRIQEGANRTRSEKAKEQHTVSKPWSGEKMVVPQVEGQPSDTKRLKYVPALEKRDHRIKHEQSSSTAKAALLEVSRPAVERADFIRRKSPELAAKVASGELPASSAIREIRRYETISRLEDIGTKKIKALEGTYDVIVVDPPWPMQKIERDVRPNQSGFDYPVMTEEEIKALPIPAADDCHLWLWTTQKFLPMAFRCLDAWNFKYICAFVWHKPGGFQPIGLPQYNCEFALYARKGSPSFVDTKAFNACFEAPRGAHSEKPDAFYDMVRRVTAGRRADMFNRRQIDGFDGWGNEAQ